MVKRRKKSISQKQIRFWITLAMALVAAIMQQTGKPVSETTDLPSPQALQNVSIASVYDGDTFKINLNCSMAVYCEKVPVRVLGVDTPEIKGKTAKEKRLAKQAKAFTQAFLQQEPITLSNCARDKYFRLLCDVTNATGQNLAQELIKHQLGYEYWGGTKSTRFQ